MNYFDQMGLLAPKSPLTAQNNAWNSVYDAAATGDMGAFQGAAKSAGTTVGPQAVAPPPPVETPVFPVGFNPDTSSPEEEFQRLFGGAIGGYSPAQQSYLMNAFRSGGQGAVTDILSNPNDPGIMALAPQNTSGVRAKVASAPPPPPPPVTMENREQNATPVPTVASPPPPVVTGPVMTGTGGTDPIGNAAASGGPPPASDGDVFDYAPPENTILPQLEGAWQQVLDVVQGNSTVPGMEDVLAGLEEKQREEALMNEQLLALRGVSNSSGIGLADDERERLGTRHRAETADRAQGFRNNYIQSSLAPLNAMFAQGSAGRQQSLNEFLAFLDRQFNRDDQASAEETQAMMLMLNALGLNANAAQMPSFTANPGEPGFMENLGTWLSTQGV